MKKLLTISLTMLAAGVLSASAADAKAIWTKDCAKCHGADGAGKTAMGKKLALKDYTDAKVQAAMKDEEMVKAIKEGVKKDGKEVMKAFPLSDAEIKSLVTYVREMKKK